MVLNSLAISLRRRELLFTKVSLDIAVPILNRSLKTSASPDCSIDVFFAAADELIHRNAKDEPIPLKNVLLFIFFMIV
jgi:hypothetical protein